MINLNADRGDGKSRLCQEHLVDLKASGLTDDSIMAAHLYSISGGDAIREILGTHLSMKTANKMSACLAFPYLDPFGNAMTFRNADGVVRPFIRLKPLKPRDDKKKPGKSIKYESPIGATPRAYFPPGTRSVLADPAVALLITEGEKKSLAADQHGFRCIGLGGVWAWQASRPEDKEGKKIGARELIEDFAAVAWAGRRVFIVYDSDLAEKAEVQWAEWHLAEQLRSRGADVRVVRLPAATGGEKVGLDDFLVANGPEALAKLIDTAVAPTRPKSADERPTIIIGTDEYRVNDEAIGALAGMKNLYHRGGNLVRCLRAEPNDSPVIVRRDPGSPVIRPLPPPSLRELMTYAAQWVKLVERKEEILEVPAHPPEWSVSQVHARGHWPPIRRLEAVVDHPVILPDGSMLATNGYDAGTGLMVCIPRGLTISVPVAPTRDDVAAAVATLNDVLVDFPFECPSHRSAWFAGLLSPLSWFAFNGPAPMLLIDANVRAAGKGLLANVIALILTGRGFAVMSYTADREEMRKRITSVAMEGERMVLLDNLAGAIGNDVFDAALTTDRWKDRILGVNKVYDGPLNVCWYATGNNVELRADTSRRCSHCRLESPLELPELRTDLCYPDLRAHVLANRGPLLSAALTIAKGWYAAGCPKHDLKPWGSFEGWSAVVREMVVFAGLPDPGETRQELQMTADRDSEGMSAIIAALEQMDGERRGVTAAEVIEAVRKPTDSSPDWVPEMRSAVEELCGRLDGRALAYKLRHFCRRNFGGKMIDRSGTGHGGVVRWAVYPAGSRSRTSPPSSPSPPCDGGDGDDGGDAPAQSGSRVKEKRKGSGALPWHERNGRPVNLPD
jgi:hypothetical protein